MFMSRFWLRLLGLALVAAGTGCPPQVDTRALKPGTVISAAPSPGQSTSGATVGSTTTSAEVFDPTGVFAGARVTTEADAFAAQGTVRITVASSASAPIEGNSEALALGSPFRIELPAPAKKPVKFEIPYGSVAGSGAAEASPLLFRLEQAANDWVSVDPNDYHLDRQRLLLTIFVTQSDTFQLVNYDPLAEVPGERSSQFFESRGKKKFFIKSVPQARSDITAEQFRNAIQSALDTWTYLRTAGQLTYQEVSKEADADLIIQFDQISYRSCATCGPPLGLDESIDNVGFWRLLLGANKHQISFHSGYTWSTGDTADRSGSYDLESTAVHEIGHSLGLSHIDRPDCGTPRGAVANSSLYPSLGSPPVMRPCAGDAPERALWLRDAQYFQTKYSKNLLGLPVLPQNKPIIAGPPLEIPNVSAKFLDVQVSTSWDSRRPGNGFPLWAKGGIRPYTWTISGQLPPGLTPIKEESDDDGRVLPGFPPGQQSPAAWPARTERKKAGLAGTLSSPGRYRFTLTVRDSSATPQTASRTFVVSVAAKPVVISQRSFSFTSATPATVNITQEGYAGAFRFSSGCNSIISVSPTGGAGPDFALTPIGRGSCRLGVSGLGSDSFIDIAVTAGFAEANGSIAGTVKDASSGSALSNALVAITHLGSPVASTTTRSDGTFTASLPPGSNYRVDVTKAGYVTSTYRFILVQPDTATPLDAILQVATTGSPVGSVSGTVISALDNSGVSDVTINLRLGINVLRGDPNATTTSGPGGAFAFINLDAGNYTAEIASSRHNTAYFTFVVIGGQTTAVNGYVSPIVPAGQTRIVLTWGYGMQNGNPYSDLDGHLTGPTPDGGRFHTYFGDLKATSGGTTYAALDIDACPVGACQQDSGPWRETTTVYQQLAGLYRFSVHDYYNRLSSNSTPLSATGAKISLYRGNDLVSTFNVPNQTGTLWTVFEMTGDAISPINEMSFWSDSPSVRHLRDGWLLRDLPAKPAHTR